MKPLKILLKFFLILFIIGLVIFLSYIIGFHHNAPPIPILEDLFDNVDFDISDGEQIPYMDEGLYNWKITNLNDFTWPNPLIVYGDHHLFFGWEVIEPGQTLEFSNAFLVNTETQEIEAIPLKPGESVEIKLKIDFTDENSLPSRFWKFLGLYNQKTYNLGTWSR